jgi:hypothetical protein
MKTTSAKMQLQLLALILDKKGRRENCAQTQTVLNQTKLKAQLFQKRPDHLRAKPPLVSHIGLAIAALIIDCIHLTTKDQNTNPIDIKLHNNNTLHPKKCG